MRLLAIQVEGRERPVLCRTEDYVRFYWGASGPSWLTPRSYRVLKDYGELERAEDEAASERLEVTFVQDFPPAPELKDSEGWIAPDGSFFPCAHGSHTTAAWTLYVMAHGRPVDEAREALREAGWLEVHMDRVMMNFDGAEPVPITREQLKALHDLLAIKEDTETRRRFEQAIQNFERQDLASAT